ncbi:ABC transporter permease [Rugosimonospora acidiphila]|uniref:ABC transporter permease n=1 Tax=Rugosimonospora acidiphila TaxID=556531 RepID=A0ABP9SB91_9ACTN
MLRAALRWLLSSAALLFVVTALTFVLVSLAPGDAAKAILSNQSSTYSPEQYQQMRHLLGIDQPLPAQYWHWLGNLLHGSLGTDLFSGQSITDALGERIGPSLSITLGTVLLSGVVGTGLGVLSARRAGLVGRIVDAAALAGFAVPNFWLALLLVELLALKLTVFPPGGYVPLGASVTGWLHSLVLPVATLSAGGVAFVAKQTRDAMTQVLSAEFVTMLRARGLSTRSIVIRHALRNAAGPVVTVLGLLLVSLLSGAVVIESFFSIPGLGQQAAYASGTHDLPMITGVAFCFTVLVVAANLLVDLSYRWLNPKVGDA